MKKGEKGIAISAPCKYKISPSSDGPSAASSDGKAKDSSDSAVSGSGAKVAASERRPTAGGLEIRGFRVVQVFDISQTEGTPNPPLVRHQIVYSMASNAYLRRLLAHFSISGRSQRRGRPLPRSIIGRGMSSYFLRYSLTVFRWASPRMPATS